MRLDQRIQLFVVLSAIFVTCLLVGDIIGGKLLEVQLFGRAFVISAGMVPFPVTFLLTDLLNEFYGKRAARFVTWIGFTSAVLALLILQLSTQLPWAPFTRGADWTGVRPGAFDNVFAGSRRILYASMMAYLVGQFTDIAVFNLLKRLSRNRMLWLRATGSTLFSQLIDTIVVQALAWEGLLDFGRIVALVVTSYAVKLAVAIGLTPLIYAGHALVERWLHIPPVRLDHLGRVIDEGAAFAVEEREPRPAQRRSSSPS
ncbi:MAG TPA: queuosine precursor transporter [Myxococcaceae bacterium]|nr:queuosine precursor transporter [Myxococcaceae bacterium]